jgi:hypothetical protein
LYSAAGLKQKSRFFAFYFSPDRKKKQARHIVPISSMRSIVL